MRLLSRLSTLGAGLMGLGCLVLAVRGLLAASGLADAQAARDARGFAGFAGFLAVVFVAIAVVSWRFLDRDGA